MTVPKKPLSSFEKACRNYPCIYNKPESCAIRAQGGKLVRFVVRDGRVYGQRPTDSPGQETEGPEDTASVGEIMQFFFRVVNAYELMFLDLSFGEPAESPTKLAGSASGKGRNFEQALMDGAHNLEKKGRLTMGRYPVASIMMKGSKFPMQVPSLPDFEGVTQGGKQFIMEAKVCTQPSFRVRKAQIKHKQVRHMLTRSEFGVPCWVVIHFNERVGTAFYDPPFTVAIPVKREVAGGWPVWEQFATVKKKDLNKEFTPITRELALKLGTRIHWATPNRCRNAYPDLESLILND